MKRDWQTVTENKQMQQSVTLAFFLPVDMVPGRRSVDFPLFSGVEGAPPSALSWRRAFVLIISYQSPSRARGSLLEFVSSTLPFSTHLDPHLYTSEHILVTSLVIYSEL